MTTSSRQTAIRRFYDRNTAWMLRFGRGRGEAAIHRPVWAPSARTRAEAIHTVDRLIAAALALSEQAGARQPQAGRPGRRRPVHLLDLGCGVGGSALWLAERHALRVTGVTLSPLQARTAGRLAARRALAGRCRFLVADYTRLPALARADAAYAIESFSHGADAPAFFLETARVLAPGARLILCDDFLGRDISLPAAQRWLARFRDGWRLGSLLPAEQVLSLAAAHGFHGVERKNLSPFLKPAPAPVALLQRLAGRAFRGTSWGASLYGGSALEICLARGWVEYLFLVLEKR